MAGPGARPVRPGHGTRRRTTRNDAPRRRPALQDQLSERPGLTAIVLALWLLALRAKGRARACARLAQGRARARDRPSRGEPQRRRRRHARGRVRACRTRRPVAGAGCLAASPVVLLRMPETLKREIQAEAFRTSTNTNDVIVRTLADGLGIPHDSRSRRSVPFGGGRGKDHRMAESNGSENGSDALEGEGARRDHRRRQLRELAPAGRRVLQGGEVANRPSPG